MGQANNNKWSPSYKKAIVDFTKSVGLESSSLNADSYYLRGESKEISQGEKAGCADFSAACDLGHKEGCFKYDDLCYPETGYMPYKKYFGEGVHSGINTLYLDNTKSTTDALMVLQNINTGIKVRSQFIRKGEDLTMREIPNGNYWIKQFDGNNWTYDAIMPDGLTKGGFTINQEISRSSWNCPYGYECNREMTLYLVEGGSLKSEEIGFNEFMR